MKVCTKCNTDKDESQYYSHRTGKHNSCKDCMREKSRDVYRGSSAGKHNERRRRDKEYSDSFKKDHVSLIKRNMKIVELALTGLSLRKIGDRYNIGKSAVYRILSDNGVNTIEVRKNNELKRQTLICLDRFGLSLEEYSNMTISKLNSIKRMLNSSKQRSKAKSLEHNITFKDLYVLWEDNCPVFGVAYGSGSNIDYSRSLDRIDSSKGYTKDNIHIISWRANRIKSDSTFKELTQLTEFITKLNNNHGN